MIDAQPSHFLSHLVGHEATGSLLSYLKEKGALCSPVVRVLHLSFMQDGPMHYLQGEKLLPKIRLDSSRQVTFIICLMLVVTNIE